MTTSNESKTLSNEFKNLTFSETSTQQDQFLLVRRYLNEHFIYNHKQNKLTFTFPIHNSVDSFINMIKDIKYTRNDYNISFIGVNIIDVLGLLYPSAPVIPFGNISNGELLYNLLIGLINTNDQKLPSLVFFKNDPQAISPTKAHYSDSGYDLTIIKKVKDIG